MADLRGILGLLLLLIVAVACGPITGWGRAGLLHELVTLSVRPPGWRLAS